jgi:tryptophanyl-tRNA synthetase
MKMEMKQQKKVLLSGVKPTGRPHIGNYFGSMKQWIDFQRTHPDIEKYFMIADYHALNFIQNKEELSQNIFDVALDYLALGIDPKQSIIFQTSSVPEHTELAWVFETLTTMPYLMRAHAFKDAEAKNKEIAVGTFNYPILMAADILLYDSTIVPVGQDQKQHVEIARDTAEKFNRTYCKTEPIFTLPDAMILKEIAVVPGTDGQKMSKSYHNTIPLFASDEEIKKAVMGIVTDSSSGIPKNVYAIHKLFKTEAELKNLYKEKAGKYKDLKDALINDIIAFIKPLRDRRQELGRDRNYVLKVLKEGGEKARAKASEKMNMVRKAIGLNLN